MQVRVGLLQTLRLPLPQRLQALLQSYVVFKPAPQSTIALQQLAKCTIAGQCILPHKPEAANRSYQFT
jgi:hypothetical protein